MFVSLSCLPIYSFAVPDTEGFRRCVIEFGLNIRSRFVQGIL